MDVIVHRFDAEANDDEENSLQHYGVKGMKWRHKKGRKVKTKEKDKADKKAEKKAKKELEKIEKFNGPVPISQWRKATNKYAKIVLDNTLKKNKKSRYNKEIKNAINTYKTVYMPKTDKTASLMRKYYTANAHDRKIGNYSKSDQAATNWVNSAVKDAANAKKSKKKKSSKKKKK